MINKSKLVLLASVLSFGVPSLAYSLDLGLGDVVDIEETLDLDETLDDVVEDVGGVVDEIDVEDVLEVDVTDAAQEILDHADTTVDDVLGGDVEGALNEVEAVVADVEINSANGFGIGLGGDPDDDIALNTPELGDLPGLPGLPGLPEIPEIPGLPGLPGGGGNGGGGGNNPGGNGGNGGTIIVNVPGSTIVRGGGGGGGAGGGGGGMSAYQQLLARFNAMTTAQRGQLIAQCLAVLANPRQYGPDQVQLCQMVAQIPGIMGYLNVAAR